MTTPACKGRDMDLRASLRSLFTLLAAGVAVLGVIATTPPEATIGNTVEGQALSLSPDRPSATASFAFQANDAAFEEARRIGVHVHHRAFWSGTGGGPPPELPVEVRKVAGPELREWELTDRGCGGTARCIGTYLLSFRWPLGLRAESVRVEWSVTAEISYDRSKPPAGAEARVRVEQPVDTGDAAVRFFEDHVLLGTTNPIVLRRVDVRAPEGIPKRVQLALELERPRMDLFEPGVYVAMLEEGPSAKELLPSTSTPLDVPARCRRRSCSFSFSVLANLRPPYNHISGSIAWALTSTEPLPLVRVAAEERSIPTLSRTASLGPIHLEGESTTARARIRVRLSQAGLSAADLVGAPPVIQGRLALNAAADTLVFPDRGRLDIQWTFPAATAEPPRTRSHSATRYRYNVLNDQYPDSFIVPNDCAPGFRCDVEFFLQFATAGPGFSPGLGVVAMEPTIELFVAYPITGAVPSGAILDIDVEPGR